MEIPLALSPVELRTIAKVIENIECTRIDVDEDGITAYVDEGVININDVKVRVGFDDNGDFCLLGPWKDPDT